MRILSRGTLRDFWESGHVRAQGPLKTWFAVVSSANYGGPIDVKADFVSASFLKDNRVVFNIGGNNYRLVVHINYALQLVFVKFIGTHAEYDRIDAGDVKR